MCINILSGWDFPTEEILINGFIAIVILKGHFYNKKDGISIINTWTFFNILETAMGENINAQTKSESEYIKAVAIINVLIRRRTMNPLFWYDFIYMFTKEGKEHARCLKLLHKFTRDIIMKRDQEFDSSNYGIQKRVAFLDLLLKIKHEDNKLTFDDIQEEVDTFMFEGHDTTSCVLGNNTIRIKISVRQSSNLHEH